MHNGGRTQGKKGKAGSLDSQMQSYPAQKVVGIRLTTPTHHARHWRAMEPGARHFYQNYGLQLQEQHTPQRWTRGGQMGQIGQRAAGKAAYAPIPPSKHRRASFRTRRLMEILLSKLSLNFPFRTSTPPDSIHLTAAECNEPYRAIEKLTPGIRWVHIPALVLHKSCNH